MALSVQRKLLSKLSMPSSLEQRRSGTTERSLIGNSPAALLVMPPERRRTFLDTLASLTIPVCAVASCREALQLLPALESLELVITDASLCDGNWRDVLEAVVNSGLHASVVVCSSGANENLWSEVVWRGAYDLLVQPCEPEELCHSVEGALRAARCAPAPVRGGPQLACP